MQIAVGELIADLLYENDTVGVPGLGAFTKKTLAASLDQIQDKAFPETNLIEFNANLAMDDGLLIAYIKDRFELSYVESKRTVSEYVEQVNQALDRKEIVIFPQVGRLYNDFEKKLQFIPDNTNFNLATFGLPAVEISPVKKTTSTAAAAAVVQSAPSRFQWLSRNWPLLVILLILLAVLVGFMIYYPKYLENQQLDPTADLPTDRLNVKPSVEEAPDTIVAEIPPSSTDDYDDAPETEEPREIAPNTKTCVIALGIFKEKANVDQLSKRLINAGYEPYIEKLSSSTRVGIQFPYTEQQEINNALRDIRSKFVQDAFVLKK